MSWTSSTYVKLYRALRFPGPTKFLFNFDPSIMTSIMTKHLSKSNFHLDIGVASVDDIIESNISNKKKQSINISLLDYAQAPLDLAVKDLISHGYNESNIETVCCDILKLDDTNMNQFKLIEKKNNKTFDTISMISLLSSIQGPMYEKLPLTLDNLCNMMDEKTILFGCTMFHRNDDVEFILNDYFDQCMIEKYKYHVVFQVTKLKKKKKKKPKTKQTI